MAKSTFALDSNKIITLTDDTQNAVADINTTIGEIQTKFDAMLETSTGHSHSGTDSPSISLSINDMTLEEYVLVQLMGMDF